MLWYKSWLETRWRFLIGLALLMILACGTIFQYPQLAARLPFVRTIDATGAIGRALNDAVEVHREYRGFIWWQWYRQNLTQMWTLFAVLLGSGGLLAKASGGAALLTLSLPVSRNRLFGVRAATGLAELLVLAVVPSLLIPLLSPAIGQSYAIADAVIHGISLFVAGAVFFSLAVLLSTIFDDLWRPLLLACAIAVVALFELVARDLSPFGIFRLMTGEMYFRSGRLPLAELLVTAAVSLTMLYAAARTCSTCSISRR